MEYDISDILNDWDYRPGQVMVRKFTGKEGREIIQLRIDLGILQMYRDGRPDGKKPMGYESWFDFYLNRLEEHRDNVETSDDYELNAEDCSRLQMEAIQYHHRYISLLQLDDFEGVLRDTQRNLELYDFVDEFADSDEASWAFQQFRPQLLMMQCRAQASLELKEDRFEAAMEIVQKGLEELKEFYEEYGISDQFETSSEVLSLNTWKEDIIARKPLSELEKLEAALKKAVREEDYEKAAQMRDKIRNLGTDSGQ